MIRLVVPEMGPEELEAVREVLDSGYLVQGENVQRFEQLIADFLGADHVIAVSSGTAALHLCVLALDIGPGDEVIVPDFTFPATANVVVQAGARPVFADVDLESFNSDAAHVEMLISARTRAIMPVHLFGLSAPMDDLLTLANQNNLLILEDAACALGSEYHGLKCGTMGHAGCFSLHPRKAITTGEGGLIVTRDASLAKRLRSLRNHGMTPGPDGYEFTEAGLNYRMTNFQGALGVVQMSRLRTIVERRRELANTYNAILANVPGLRLPSVPPGSHHIYQSYVILLDETLDRRWIVTHLREQGIECTIGTYACHAQPFFREKFGYRPGDLPASYAAFRRTLALPLHSRMTRQDVETVADALRRAVS
jgi:perosamine synthetase